MEKMKKEIKKNKDDVAKLELYTLIGEGYKAKKEGRVSELSAVKKRLSQRTNMSV